MFSQNVEIVQSIKEKLSQIERRENIRILYACESGSRAWGFASADSDYDVRFIFVRPLEDYLRIKDLPDFIDAELNEVYDINGWDFKKFCNQLNKSNPVLFEWIQSPIVYKSTSEWEEFRELFLSCFNDAPVFYHYFGMAKKNIFDLIDSKEKCNLSKKSDCNELSIAFENSKDDVSYKKYLYVLRPILACQWIKNNKSIVPTEFIKLVDASLPEELKPCVMKLLELKRNSCEKQSGKRIEKLDNFINCKIQEMATYKKSKIDDFYYENLDLIFQKILKAGVAGDREWKS